MYPTFAKCDTINDFTGYFGMDDISKNKGIACNGDGCPQSRMDPQLLDRVEMNVEFCHYSMLPFLFLGGRAMQC